jgi:hypothetical protein
MAASALDEKEGVGPRVGLKQLRFREFCRYFRFLPEDGQILFFPAPVDALRRDRSCDSKRWRWRYCASRHPGLARCGQVESLSV